MSLVEHNHMIQTLASNRTDQALQNKSAPCHDNNEHSYPDFP